MKREVDIRQRAPEAGKDRISRKGGLQDRKDTMLNALNLDQNLFFVELSLAQARRDELLSLVQLYIALGGG